MINIPDEVKRLLKDDNVTKNFRVHFPNGEREDITNENIVEESVSLTEKICSEEKLKFGLFESSELNFETFGIEKIKGYTIEVSLEIYCSETVQGAVYRQDLNAYVYPISYGTFVVDSCKKQADMNYRQIVAYSPVNYETPLSYVTSVKNLINTSLSINGESALVFINPEKVPLVDAPGEFDDYYNYNFRTTKNGHNYRLSVVMTKMAGFGRLGGGLEVINEIHSSNYVSKVSELKRAIIDKGVPELIEKSQAYEYGSDFFNYERRESDGNRYISRSDMNIFRDILNPKENNYYVIQCNAIGSPVGTFRLDDDFYVPNAISFYEDDHLIVRAGDGIPAEMRLQFAFGLGPSSVSDYFVDFRKIYTSIRSETSSKSVKFYKPNIEDIVDIDWREIAAAYAELNAVFNIFDRNGTIKSISAADNFDNPIMINKNEYKSLWYDDDYSLPIGRIICTYKESGGATKFIERIIVDDYSKAAYRTYSITFNYFIQNNAYSELVINRMINKMVQNISSKIVYMPMELSMIGRPDLEAGDVVHIETDEGHIIGLVEKRELSGMKALNDSIVCVDDINQLSNNGLKSDYDEETGILTIYL